jgi:predicted metalloprotease with PDZ domain
MRAVLVSLAFLSLSSSLAAQRTSTRAADPHVSAPVSGLAYTVEFTRPSAVQRSLRVTTTMTTSGRGPVLLSLPTWTPGAYEISNFARNVSGFDAQGDGKALDWDKLDADTWRIETGGARQVTVSFDFRADSMDNAMAWSRSDFAFFNGTNIFLYPEGRDPAFAATVTIKTESDWKVATGMKPAGAARTYTSDNFHDLVDMPFFVGAFDLDTDGGSALEHSNSHVGIYTPQIIGNPVLPSITAHEIFHLWNVKRMRPAEMVPYRYDRAQETTLLWVSEGITDYYADLALVRGGILDSTEFLGVTRGKMEEVDAVPAVALEDASLSTWIHPRDGTGYIYYPKGSLAGLLLDIQIRDASDNASSLDDVMRDLYQRTYKAGKGFTTADFWAAVSRAAKGKSFADFSARYIDGRDPFPYAQVLSLAGLRLRVDSLKEPRIGVFTASDSAGVVVTALEPGGAAERAGVRVGDYLLSIGAIAVTEGFGDRFRARYGKAEGQTAPIQVRRGADTLSLDMTVQMATRTERQLVFDRTASPKASRIRRSILTGRP